MPDAWKELRRIMRVYDTDGDGTVGWEEFLQAPAIPGPRALA